MLSFSDDLRQLCEEAFADRVALQLPNREDDRVSFERGIDPDVDDPSQVHCHSECLEEWPSHDEYERYDWEVESAMKTRVRKSGMTADVLMAIEHTDMVSLFPIFSAHKTCANENKDI